MKKKILHLLSSNSYSGAENVAINMIKSLSSDYEFIYVSPKGAINDILNKENINNICVQSMNPFNLNLLFRKLKPDIIHAHDFRASIISSLTLYPCPVISHLHQNPSWIKKNTFYSLVYKATAPLYNKVLVVSNEILKEAVFSHNIRSKSHVLHNYVDIEKVLNCAKTSDSEKYDIAFIGRLEDVKDPLRFIDIMNEIIKSKPSLKVAMVGGGKLEKECEEKISALNIRGNINMKGFIMNPYPIMNNSKVVVMPSQWEGFGLVAVESMLLGTPVFASSVGGLKSIISDECGGLCADNDEFISKITDVLDSSEFRYKSISDNCKKKSANFGNNEQWKWEIKTLYESLLK